MTNDRSASRLNVHEELLLVALKDREGSINWRASQLKLVIAGGIMADLLLRHHIDVTSDTQHRVRVVDSGSTDHAVLDEAIETIQDSERQMPLQDWVWRLSRLKHLKHRVAETLCDRGVLRAEEERVLFFFKKWRYPEVDSGPESRLAERLRDAIFSESSQIELRTAVELSLLYHSGWINILIPHDQWTDHQDRIERISDGDLIGEATQEAIQAAQAAAAIATTMPSMTAGTPPTTTIP